MRIFARLSAIALMIAFGFAGICQASAQAPAVIRIGTPDQSVGTVPSGGVSLVTYVAVRKLLEQEFAKDGIKVEWTYFKGAGPAVNEALANKQLDFAYLGDLALVIGRANGLRTRFLVPVRGINTYLVTPVGSDIKSIADLKGKRVTVFRGTTYQLTLDRALESVGLTERDLQIVNLDWTAALAAIAAKQIDADWVGGQALPLKDKGLADIPVSSITLGPKSTFMAGFIGTEDFISAHPDLTQRMVNVLVEAEHQLSQDAPFEAFLKLATESSGLTLVDAKADYQGAPKAFRFSPRIDDFVISGFQSDIDAARTLGLIRKPFVAADWVEPKFVDSALSSAHLITFWPAYDPEGKPQ